MRPHSHALVFPAPHCLAVRQSGSRCTLQQQAVIPVPGLYASSFDVQLHVVHVVGSWGWPSTLMCTSDAAGGGATHWSLCPIW